MTRRLFWTAALVALVLAAEGSPCWAAGDVTAELVDGTLYVLGDREGNEVTIVGGLDSLTLTVEGALIDSCPIDDVEALWVDAGGGDDSVYLEGSIPGDVMISTGAGRDWVELNSSAIYGNLFIESGQDLDIISVWSLVLEGSLDISTGQGADHIYFSTLVEIGGNLHVNTGVNADVVHVLYRVTVAGDVLVDFGQGDDVLNFNVWDVPLLTVGGSASFHGDQGVDRVYGVDFPFTLEDLILADEGLEVVGFE